MTKFEYVQLKEIIEQRSFRKGLVAKIISQCSILAGIMLEMVWCTQEIWALLTRDQKYLFGTHSMIPIAFLISLGFIIANIMPDTSPDQSVLEKLKKDFEEGKDIDLSLYEDKVTKK